MCTIYRPNVHNLPIQTPDGPPKTPVSCALFTSPVCTIYQSVKLHDETPLPVLRYFPPPLLALGKYLLQRVFPSPLTIPLQATDETDASQTGRRAASAVASRDVAGNLWGVDIEALVLCSSPSPFSFACRVHPSPFPPPYSRAIPSLLRP